MSTNLEKAKKKLVDAGISYEDLPKDRNAKLWDEIRAIAKLDINEMSAVQNDVCGTATSQASAGGHSQCFEYCCQIVRGRTFKRFRANLFGLAERYGGYTRANTSTDGIITDGKNIKISLIFRSIGDMNNFQSEVIEFISTVSGHKRPLIEVKEADHPHEIILHGERTASISIAESVQLNRVFKYQYQHDYTVGVPDNSEECDGYSDVVSLYSRFGDFANLSDPEVRVQMIEDPCSPYWRNMAPEGAHIKDKSKCSKVERKDPNNFIYMSRFLHCYFDGLNAKPPKFPGIKIQYVSHDEGFVPCPAIGIDPPLGLPPRQRVVVRVIFWDADVRTYAMTFIKNGGKTIDPMSYEIDMYFRDGKAARAYLEWKEAQTDKAWDAMKKGMQPAEFVVNEDIGQVGEENIDEDNIETEN